MSLTVNQRPSVNWVASSNPVLYKMTRKDYSWTSLITSGGKIQITVAGDITATNAVGDTCWLQSDDGAYSRIVTIFSRAFAAGNTTVVFNEPWVANNVSGYFNNTTQRKNYYVSVGIYSYINAVSALITTMTYSPNNKGLVTIDVAQPLNASMNPNFAGVPNVSNFVSPDPNAVLIFYIKYTEVWTGSANGETDDVANKFTAVYGAVQIGSVYPYASNDLFAYTQNGAFLTPFTKLRAAYDENHALSWIDFNASNNGYLKYSFYQNQTLLCTYYNPGYTGSNRFLYQGSRFVKAQPRFGFPAVFPDRNFGAGTAWTFGAGVTLAAGATSQRGAMPFFVPNGTATLSCTFKVNTGGQSMTMNILLLDAAGAVVSTTSAFVTTTGGVIGTKVLTAPSADAYFLAYQATNNGGAPATLTLASYFDNYFVLPTPTLVNRIDFQWVNTGLGVFNETNPSNVLTMDLFDADNPVTLVWRNNNGGVSTWTFDYNQDKAFTQGSMMKAKRLSLFTNKLTQNQWDSLNELNSMGEVYQPAIVELTGLIATSIRRGQQVYIVDNTVAGNLIPVIVLPTNSKTKSRRISTELDITIELPEYFQQR